MEPEALLLLPLWYAVFLLSLTCHEAAHAWVALLGGDPTAYAGGQVTLNPVPHMQREPFGTIVIPLIAFFMTGGAWMMGWASAPYDPLWALRHPKRNAAMAAAGPAANLVLVGIAFVVMKVLLSNGTFVPSAELAIDSIVAPASEEAGLLGPAARLLSIAFTLNLVLFLFNLFPFPPLDGSAIVMGLFPATRSLYEKLRELPAGGWLGIVIAWVLFPKIFPHLFEPLLALLLAGGL